MPVKKAMPVGVEDFGKIITGNYCWMDKTRFIRELLDAHGDVTLITRPYRFRKTLMREPLIRTSGMTAMLSS